jgi:hypothetical protein
MATAMDGQAVSTLVSVTMHQTGLSLGIIWQLALVGVFALWLQNLQIAKIFAYFE